jgi:uncharacterized membrane protein YccC
MISSMKLWAWDEKNLPSITHAIRTAVAATASLIIARLVQMPRGLLGRDRDLGCNAIYSRRDAGAVDRADCATAVGASVGALEANYFRSNLIAYAVAIFLVGLLSIAFRLEKTAYRYTSITLTIIVLIPRSEAPWATALHRFIEVSVGIIVALAVVALWPEHQRPSPHSTAE